MQCPRCFTSGVTLILFAVLNTGLPLDARAASGSNDVLGIRRLMRETRPVATGRFCLTSLTIATSAETKSADSDLPVVSPDIPAPDVASPDVAAPQVAVPESNEGELPVPLSGPNGQAAQWFDEFAARQVLFTPQDMSVWRQLLQQMPPDALERWWNESSSLRQRLASEEWRATQDWLILFLAAQAYYTRDEIAAFRHHVAQLDAAQILQVLDHFESVFASRVASRAAAFRQGGSVRQVAPPTAVRMAQAGGFDVPRAAAAVNTSAVRRHSVINRNYSFSQSIAKNYAARALWGSSGYYYWMIPW